MHDISCRREESWGLSDDDDEVGDVRLLAYAKNKGVLFFSSSLGGGVHCYNVRTGRMEAVQQGLDGRLTALAVNADSSLLVSVAGTPSNVILRRVPFDGRERRVDVAVSRSAVEVVVFHPTRAYIFLLGFRDGTLAFYDAASVGPGDNASNTGPGLGNVSVIGAFKRLHRSMEEVSSPSPALYRTTGDRDRHDRGGVGIIAAAFLSGHETQAVSIGGDGRCIIVEHSKPKRVLRSWSLHICPTSLAAIHLGNQRHLIAIGRCDGKVMIHNDKGSIIKGIQLETPNVVHGLE